MPCADGLGLAGRRLRICLGLIVLLAAVAGLGLSLGSTEGGPGAVWQLLSGGLPADSVLATIILQIRLPRVVLAAVVGATLALGGLVFQVLLRNPLAEPYMLGVSGGSAIGAIAAMLAGLAPFPGVALSAFGGSMLTLALLLVLAAGRTRVNRDSLLLGGVMINAFCGALIMFLISLSRDSEMRHILFWLMGDLSLFRNEQLPLLLAVVPSMVLILVLARPLNLLLLGREEAAAMGVSVTLVTTLLLVATTFMVSLVVCYSGLIGFVGLVIPHILRLLLGVDHRLLAPATLLGGAIYLILCDLLARTLQQSGELPVGIITALIGAPLFIFLLWRSRR